MMISYYSKLLSLKIKTGSLYNFNYYVYFQQKQNIRSLKNISNKYHTHINANYSFILSL